MKSQKEKKKKCEEQEEQPKECQEQKKHAFREAFCKILPIKPTSKDEPVAKNQLAYLEAKRRTKVKKMIAFGIFCAITLAIILFSLLASHVLRDGTWLQRQAYNFMLVLTYGINLPYIGEYPYQVRIYPFHRTFVLVTLSFIVITVIHFLIKLLTIGSSKRRKTIIILLASLFKFVGYLIVVIFLFNIWSIDPAILAAIVTALGVAIGFGAQGVISDLLTGIFLIFENSLQVGDIITVDSFRGEVEEVGVRTTKFTSVRGDVMVVNNSELKRFVNMSMHRSVALCDFTIEYGEDIEKVEGVIGELMPVLADEYSAITEGPFYKGIQEFNSSGVKLRVIAKCNEAERMQLERDLNREFKVALDKNGIKIAVPKVGLVQVAETKTAKPDAKQKKTYIKKTPKTEKEN